VFGLYAYVPILITSCPFTISFWDSAFFHVSPILISHAIITGPVGIRHRSLRDSYEQISVKLKYDGLRACRPDQRGEISAEFQLPVTHRR
jgi:hypothetical protein